MLFAIIAAVLSGFNAKKNGKNAFLWGLAGMLFYYVYMFALNLLLAAGGVRLNYGPELFFVTLTLGSFAIIGSWVTCTLIVKRKVEQQLSSLTIAISCESEEGVRTEYFEEMEGALNYTKDYSENVKSVEIGGVSDDEFNTVAAAFSSISPSAIAIRRHIEIAEESVAGTDESLSKDMKTA
jgi:hypothetical protein